MYKIETTSKVSRKFPSRINVGRRDAARQALDFGHSPQALLSTARKEPFTGQKGPIAHTGTTNNPPALQSGQSTRRARQALDPGHSPQAPPQLPQEPPTPPPPPLTTAKAATNGNHRPCRTCPRSKPHVKCH